MNKKGISKFGAILLGLLVLAAVAGAAYYYTSNKTEVETPPSIQDSSASFQGLIDTELKHGFFKKDATEVAAWEDYKDQADKDHIPKATIAKNRNYIGLPGNTTFKNLADGVSPVGSFYIADFSPSGWKDVDQKTYPAGFFGYPKGPSVFKTTQVDPAAYRKSAGNAILVFSSENDQTMYHASNADVKPAANSDYLCGLEDGWNLIYVDSLKDGFKHCPDRVISAWSYAGIGLGDDGSDFNYMYDDTMGDLNNAICSVDLSNQYIAWVNLKDKDSVEIDNTENGICGVVGGGTGVKISDFTATSNNGADGVNTIALSWSYPAEDDPASTEYTVDYFDVATDQGDTISVVASDDIDENTETPYIQMNNGPNGVEDEEGNTNISAVIVGLPLGATYQLGLTVVGSANVYQSDFITVVHKQGDAPHGGVSTLVTSLTGVPVSAANAEITISHTAGADAIIEVGYRLADEASHLPYENIEFTEKHVEPRAQITQNKTVEETTTVGVKVVGVKMDGKYEFQIKVSKEDGTETDFENLVIEAYSSNPKPNAKITSPAMAPLYDEGKVLRGVDFTWDYPVAVKNNIAYKYQYKIGVNSVYQDINVSFDQKNAEIPYSAVHSSSEQGDQTKVTDSLKVEGLSSQYWFRIALYDNHYEEMLDSFEAQAEDPNYILALKGFAKSATEISVRWTQTGIVDYHQEFSYRAQGTADEFVTISGLNSDTETYAQTESADGNDFTATIHNLDTSKAYDIKLEVTHTDGTVASEIAQVGAYVPGPEDYLLINPPPVLEPTLSGTPLVLVGANLVWYHSPEVHDILTYSYKYKKSESAEYSDMGEAADSDAPTTPYYSESFLENQGEWWKTTATVKYEGIKAGDQFKVEVYNQNNKLMGEHEFTVPELPEL